MECIFVCCFTIDYEIPHRPVNQNTVYNYLIPGPELHSFLTPVPNFDISASKPSVVLARQDHLYYIRQSLVDLISAFVPLIRNSGLFGWEEIHVRFRSGTTLLTETHNFRVIE